MRIAAEPFDSPDARALCAAQRAEVDARYGRDTEPGAKPTAEDIAVFLIARDEDGTPLACGGLRALQTPGAVELKRMYTAPAGRGRGIGRAMLAALEAEARARGFSVARLETGDLLDEAHRLYARAGYAPIPCWGAYASSEISVCFERRLQGRTTR